MFGHVTLAKTVDQILAFVLPALYLINVAFLLLLANRQWEWAISIAIFGTALVAYAARAAFKHILAYRQQHLVYVLSQLENIESAEDPKDILEKAFKLFDSDNSGDISLREVSAFHPPAYLYPPAYCTIC